ncbi:CsgG/HfaB family protein [Pelagibacterium luteolum]|uniref:Curli production assembly/transport component CsgG n=1 Tax=Pelagibacterium luteolum TaxID=440168 RepID=A0A1G7SVY3_9HYPH|nr:CsgG/HfaB family protein [Pelagibacterium luteolum]SDG27215.1 curli production assembly/transport component CsgG [Pelagibacterium luteolum]
MFRGIAVALVSAVLLTGCATMGQQSNAPAATLVSDTHATASLRTLPPPRQPLDVAVYEFADLTGQARPNPNFAESSRAVTQGGAQILVDVLTRAGDGQWFRIAERTGLRNLVQERTLIENTNSAYGGVGPLPPIRFAGIILEGGIVGYDADTMSGGAGARYFGIGADTEYRSDTVTVNLRAVSVQNGEVLASTTTTKQIYSYMNRAGAYVFAEPQRLLEIEAGMARNDPTQLAVREAIELAVFSLVVEGLERGLWDLRDSSAKATLVAAYNQQYTAPVQ